MAAAPEHPLRWLSDRARRAPDSAAVLGPSETLTHAQLLDNLGGWSRLMRAAGLDREKPVAVVTRHRSRLARAIWLALHDGVPLLTEEELAYMDEMLEKREALLGDLLPWPHANFGLDEWWVRTYPYEQEAAAGGTVRPMPSGPDGIRRAGSTRSGDECRW